MRPRAAPRAADTLAPRLFDFAPVLRNRSAMAYALAYCVHTWEMSVVRGWGVVFLTAVAGGAALESGKAFWPQRSS